MTAFRPPFFPAPMKQAAAARILAVLLACAALPAMAAQEPAQEDFTGKYLCVEDADWSWGLSRAKVVKVGGKEFLAGEEVPPPPDRLKVEGKDGAPPSKEEPADAGEESKEDAKGRLKRHLPRDGKPARCRVLLPMDKVLDIRVFDTEADFNGYMDSIDDAGKEPDEAPTVL